MIGAPGAGKGTQADLVCRQYGLPKVASGELFRENLQRETELGKLAKSYMDRGELVPDDVTVRMVSERLSRPDTQAGAVLDGFPRNVAQAEALDEFLAGQGEAIRRVFYIKVSPEELLERLSGRWLCRANQHPYHVRNNPPKVPGVCDLDGSPLYQRDDDKPKTVQRRIQVYLDQTAPLIDYYRGRGILAEIHGERPIEDVFADISAQLATDDGRPTTEVNRPPSSVLRPPS
jgi:adenylate kinase